MKKLAVAILWVSGAILPGATTDEFFDDSRLHEVRLTLDPNDWQALKDNYLEDTYYPAAFQWGELRVENVGIRSRGSGSRNAEKPGLKVDFNQYVSQDFLGLKSVVLDNLVQDAAMMSERLSLALYRRAGVPAPRLSHARLYINDNYYGLYTIVEPVDKVFLRRAYGEDKGDLYDYGWASYYHFEYLGSDPVAYFPVPFEPKTNTSSYDGASLIELTRLASEGTDEEFAAAIGRYVDVPALLKYLAVEAYIGDLDGLIGDWGLNNFYLYRKSGATKFYFIAWDKDVTFRDASRSIWQNADDNALFRRLFAIPEYREAYLAAIEESIQLAAGWLDQELVRTYDQINVAALEDTKSPYPYSEFDLNVSLVQNYLYHRPFILQQQIYTARNPVSE